jgi:uncharacterized RDD family membrane protein YckC
MSCPNCGASVPDQATQCPSCGTPLQTAAGAPGTSGGASWGPPPGPPPTGFTAYPTEGGANQLVSTAGQLAGWWRRVGATILDGIIVGVVAAVVGLAVGRVGQYVLEAVLGLIYTTYLLVYRGQTVGMMAVGTRCVRENDGQNLTVGPAVGRWFIEAILGVTGIGFLLDVLWPLWDKKNQTIHDKAVHTVVVRVG